MNFATPSDIEPLLLRLNSIRQELREWITNHVRIIPHDKTRKKYEIKVFTEVLEVVVKKWTIPLLWELEVHQGLHFNELNRNIVGISSRTLSDRLKELEETQIINRLMEDSRPPKVFYQLTDKGKGLVELSLLIVLHVLNF